MMALGYFLRAVGIFNQLFLKQENTLCFKVFLPLVLFINVYKSNFFGRFLQNLFCFHLAVLSQPFYF